MKTTGVWPEALAAARGAVGGGQSGVLAPGRARAVNICATPVPELWRGSPATVVDPETATESLKKSPRRRRAYSSMSFFFPRVFG
jgi:hypothetical protein